MENFSVTHINPQNPHHWDIYTKRKVDGHFPPKRLFCIRGESGRFIVRDERQKFKTVIIQFKTVIACMSYICDQLMYPPDTRI